MTALSSFEQVLRAATDLLVEGSENRRSAAHTPVVSTADGDMRVMVLRAVELEPLTLRFHTDARAPKSAIVEADPTVHVLVYDPEAKTQLRMAGRAEILREGAAVEAAWNEASNFAKRCYLGDAPGTPSPIPTSGLPSDVEGIEPSDQTLAPARANFALLTIRVEEIDWFTLDHHGHCRAVIDLKDRSKDRWVAP